MYLLPLNKVIAHIKNQIPLFNAGITDSSFEIKERKKLPFFMILLLPVFKL